MFLFTTFKHKHLEQKTKIQSQEGASFLSLKPLSGEAEVKIWGWSEQYTCIHRETERDRGTLTCINMCIKLYYIIYGIHMCTLYKCLLGISVASANTLRRKDAAEVISDKPGTICWGYWFCLRLSHSAGAEFPFFCTSGECWWCWSGESSWGVLRDTFLMRVLYKTVIVTGCFIKFLKKEIVFHKLGYKHTVLKVVSNL